MIDKWLVSREAAISNSKKICAISAPEGLKKGGKARLIHLALHIEAENNFG